MKFGQLIKQKIAWEILFFQNPKENEEGWVAFSY